MPNGYFFIKLRLKKKKTKKTKKKQKKQKENSIFPGNLQNPVFFLVVRLFF